MHLCQPFHKKHMHTIDLIKNIYYVGIVIKTVDSNKNIYSVIAVIKNGK